MPKQAPELKFQQNIVDFFIREHKCGMITI